MNTINELLSSKEEKEEVEIKETTLEKKVLKNKERKERKLDQDYKELTQLENKTWVKILAFACPFIGTLFGVFWSLFTLGVDRAQLILVVGLLVSTAIGNVVGGLLSAKITNDELARTEIDMYNGMKTKHMKSEYEREQAIKDKNKAEADYNKLFDETTQLRKDYEERKIQEEVARRMAEKEKEIEERIQLEIDKRVEIELEKKKEIQE
jgi:hypothetical protein